MTKYERGLRKRLQDPELWPCFDGPDFLDRLDRVAGRALEKRSVEGNLAAILIFHQLVEEMLKLLILDNHFLLQLALLGRRVGPATRRRPMFGQLQQELRESPDFLGKDRFLSAADRINALRIQVVHKLTSRGSLALRRDSLAAKRAYDKAYAIFESAHDNFRVDFHGFRKDLM